MASEPPPLPEGFPPPVPPPLPQSTLNRQPSAILHGRLHPCTLVFAAWNALRNILVPLIVIVFFGRRGSMDTYVFFGLLFVSLPIGLAVLKYYTFTYRIEAGELVTKQGILGRTERNIPLHRVQDIRIEQGVLHRLLGMAEVHVETAGGRGAEASLSVLSRAEADRLRAAVFERRPAAAAAVEAGAPTLAGPPTGEIVRALSVRELVLAGLTSNRIASALAIVFVFWQFLDDLLPKETYERFILSVSQTIEHSLQSGGHISWVAIILGAMIVVVVGLIFSVAGSLVTFYGFTLSRRGEDLHRAYGLFTRRSSSLPRRRIQVLQIEETWLRRLFGLATLRADTAGSSPTPGEEEGSGRDVLLPVVRRTEVDGLLPMFFPDFDAGSSEWHKISRRAITRGTFKGSLGCLLLAGVSFGLQRQWTSLWPLLFLPTIYMLNVLSYRRLGYCVGDGFFLTRRGVAGRSTHIVPIRNAQSIVIRQTPFDRRHRVATLTVDTAGQATTGGGPRIHNVPVDEAITLGRTLAQRAAGTRYRWQAERSRKLA